MKLTKEQLAKAKEAKTFEELLTLAIAENVDATSEEITAFWNSLHGEGELADDELDNVAGGCNDIKDNYYYEFDAINSADPRCPVCNRPLRFVPEGKIKIHRNGKDYMCDEYECPVDCDGNGQYLHVWEGDRWLYYAI